MTHVTPPLDPPLLQTSAARSGAQGKVGSYIIINLQIWDVSRRYQLALSLTNQNKQLYLPQSHCLFCFHSRFTFIRSTLGSKDKMKLSLGRASAERKSGRSDRPQTRVFSPVQTARVTKSGAGPRSGPPPPPRRVVLLVLTHPGHCLVRSTLSVPLAAGSANRGANRALAGRSDTQVGGHQIWHVLTITQYRHDRPDRSLR